MSDNLKIAQDIQTKFRFYFVGLVFTLLAATIQTSDFKDISVLIITMELLSWVALTISGLTGLSYLEDSPGILKHHHAMDANEGNDDLVEKIKKSYISLDKLMSFRYQISKHTFTFGIVFLVISRAIQGL